MRNILAIDPSGNFNEGKGTTGWALFAEDKKLVSLGQVLAKHYNNKFEYWLAVLDIVKHSKADIIVIEDFLLYESKSRVQINSRFETSKLIGLLETYCFINKKEYVLQRAIDVKKRWSDDILINKGYVQRNANRYYANGVLISDHIRDAIRHGVHYITYKLKERK